MKTCSICNQEKPTTAFSTLARRRASTVRKSELESSACTPCYWMQLVTHYPQLRVEDDGLCVVNYVPHDEPRWEHVTEVQAFLSLWKRDAKVIEAYSALGSINEQIRPFQEWERKERKKLT